jgi:hypothetical protein
MAVGHRRHNLAKELPCLIFKDVPMLVDVLEKVPARSVLHNHIESIGVFHCVIHLDLECGQQQEKRNEEEVLASKRISKLEEARPKDHIVLLSRDPTETFGKKTFGGAKEEWTSRLPHKYLLAIAWLVVNATCTTISAQ